MNSGFLVTPNTWRPAGISGLEPEAFAAVKARGNTLVTAGPGAGKTELLGQKAAYLLQTGICPYPRKVLAISFKRDAAKNLKERFARRCSPDQVTRLDSLTFDAFSKLLFDRFWRALPEPWTICQGYEIAPYLTAQEFYAFQREVADTVNDQNSFSGQVASLCGKSFTRAQLMGVNQNQFQAGIQSLCLHPITCPDPASFLHLVRLFWSLRQNQIRLSFGMIGRLVEAIISTNPAIRNAIRATYSHVFMDEFQDTTSVQYGVMTSIFKRSDCIVTAVGDDKQKIMGWAGAHEDAFGAYSADFLSGGVSQEQNHFKLSLNYRSNARIVEILNTLKGKIAPHESDFKAVRPAPNLPDEKICAIVVSDTEKEEDAALARYLSAELKAGTKPREIALLVRQRPVDWDKRLSPQLSLLGLKLRNEDRQLGGATIQDLMTEPYAQIMIDGIELLCLRRGGAVWARTVDTLLTLEGLSSEEDSEKARNLIEGLDRFIDTHRVPHPDSPMKDLDITTALTAIETFLTIPRLRSLAPQYQQGDFLDQIRQGMKAFLLECAVGSRSWFEMIRLYRGDEQIPLLTITKSKGLEYDLVILLGLDDVQWWSFDQNPAEGHSNFFVAASRARERLFLLFRKGNGIKKIAEIYALLQSCGVSGISGKTWAETREADLN